MIVDKFYGFRTGLLRLGIGVSSAGEALALGKRVLAATVADSESSSGHVIDDVITAARLSGFAQAKEYGKGTVEGQLRSLVPRGADLKRAFRTFDRDGSGEIDAAELMEVLKDAGADGISQDTVVALIKAFDEDGNGSLDEGEFFRFVAPDYGVHVLTPHGKRLLL